MEPEYEDLGLPGFGERFKPLSKKRLELIAGAVHKLIHRFSAMERFRAMLRQWQANREAGDLLIPLPPRKLTLAEKYSVLAAIHDECNVGVEPINPWRVDEQPSPELDVEAQLKLMPYAALRSAVLQHKCGGMLDGGIPERNEPVMLTTVADIEADLKANFYDLSEEDRFILAQHSPSQNLIWSYERVIQIDQLALGIAKDLNDGDCQAAADRAKEFVSSHMKNSEWLVFWGDPENIENTIRDSDNLAYHAHLPDFDHYVIVARTYSLVIGHRAYREARNLLLRLPFLALRYTKDPAVRREEFTSELTKCIAAYIELRGLGRSIPDVNQFETTDLNNDWLDLCGRAVQEVANAARAFESGTYQNDTVSSMCRGATDLLRRAAAAAENAVRELPVDSALRLTALGWSTSAREVIKPGTASLSVHTLKGKLEQIWSAKQLTGAQSTGATGKLATEDIPQADDLREWLTVTQAAKASGARKDEITRAANANEIATNGQTGHKRRIDAASLSKWQLKRVERPERIETDATVRAKLRRAEQ
jgi:hypothetical protein